MDELLLFIKRKSRTQTCHPRRIRKYLHTIYI